MVTGAAGFIGRNLRAALQRQPDVIVRGLDVENTAADLDRQLREAGLIFHLAGINRPQTEAEFTSGNVDFTRAICERLKGLGRTPKIVFSSSIQAAWDNAYGLSKRAAEAELERFAAETGAEVAVYRLKNVFGKWCRPSYNSVVATFCHNIARGLPLQISDPQRELDLAYIDDVVAAFLGEAVSRSAGLSFKEITTSHKVTLRELAELLLAFEASRRTLVMPDLSGPFVRKLYATFLSYLPEDDFAYALAKKADERGDLAEFIKSCHSGQIFVSRTKPGVTRGNHYHHTKTEKFLVLEGEAVIRLRQIERNEILEYPVSGRGLTVVDIPPGYTHSIENVGDRELVVLFWAGEVFEPQRPDTYFLPVAVPPEEAHEGRHDRRHAA